MAEVFWIPAIVTGAERLSELMLNIDLHQKEALFIMQAAMILEAMNRSRGNIVKAANRLGIHKNLLNWQIQELALQSKVEEVQKIAKLQIELFNTQKSTARAQAISKAFSQHLERPAFRNWRSIEASTP